MPSKRQNLTGKKYCIDTFFNVSPYSKEELIKKGRKRPRIYYKWVYCYMLRENGYTLEQIAKEFNYNSHSDVIYPIHQVTIALNYYHRDERTILFKAVLEKCEAELTPIEFFLKNNYDI